MEKSPGPEGKGRGGSKALSGQVPARPECVGRDGS